MKPVPTSQYHEEYLQEATERIAAGSRPLSVKTFLRYRLQGSAKCYTSQYARALERSLRRCGAVETESQLGGLAFKRP